MTGGYICARCGRPRKRRPGGSLEGNNGMCFTCTSRERRGPVTRRITGLKASDSGYSGAIGVARRPEAKP